jgi:glycosyltransferase involved in cell wall biosynthesis
MSTPTRIAIVTNADWYFWSHRLPIATAARERGWQVFVIAGEERGLGPRIRAEGFEFVPIPVERGSTRLGSELATFRALRSAYRRIRPALVHHVAVKPVLYGGIAARLAGVPAVINALAGQGHVAGAGGLRGRLLRVALRGAYRLAYSGRRTRAIFQNPDDLEFFVASGVVDRDRCVLIRGSGVDPDRFTPSPEPAGVPLILFASRLLRSKGLLELVEACRRLRARGIALTLRIVGEPDTANPDAIPHAQLGDWVGEGIAEWLGRQDDMPEQLAACNLVALPSNYGEGVPKILIEAAAAGRAIVTTDSPGCREIVRHGVNGYLVPRGDVEALATALAELLRDGAARARMGAVGREIAVAEFGERLVVDRTMELYDDMLAAAARKGRE